MLEKKISGLMIAYSLLCERKLWLYTNQITMEQESEFVEIGKMIDEDSYKREHKHIMVDDSINIDYMKNGIVYEIKKSSRQKEMAEYQIKYYLYTLKKHGIEDPIGVLKVPKEHYQKEIHLMDEDILFLEKQMERIKEIISSDTVPELIEKKACKTCAYYELCHI